MHWLVGGHEFDLAAKGMYNGAQEETMTLATTTRPLVEVQAYLDELLKVSDLDEVGNGLLVGGRPIVGKVGLAVNCSYQAIEGAAARSCDLLITHHPAQPAVPAAPVVILSAPGEQLPATGSLPPVGPRS